MRLKHYFYYFPKAISKPICNKIINRCKNKELSKGTVVDKNKKFTGEKDYNSRKSNVHFFTEQWVYDLIDPYIAAANIKAGWNFDYNFHEAMQFTQYKKGQFYDWHVDQHHLPYEKHASNYDGKVRKLSLTINLSDPKSYEGGNFMFDYRDKPEKPSNVETCTILRNQGTIVVFPSFVFHKVSPVTKGIRHSLVNWTIGAPWK